MPKIFKQKLFTFKIVGKNGKIEKVVLRSSFFEAMALASREFQDQIVRRTRPASAEHLRQRMSR